MNFLCHGRSLSAVPASGPEVIGRLSTNRITLSALERPAASQLCGSDEVGRSADEPRFGLAPMPIYPMGDGPSQSK